MLNNLLRTLTVLTVILGVAMTYSTNAEASEQEEGQVITQEQEINEAQSKATIKVVRSNTALRTKTSTSATSIGTLQKGDTVSVGSPIYVNGEIWYQVTKVLTGNLAGRGGYMLGAALN